MSIDIGQLREFVARPTLHYLAESNLMPYSLAGENIVLGTILTESSGRYIKQIGSGPALGLPQMEPATHDDIWQNWLSHPARKPLAARLEALDTIAPITRGAYEMVGNLFYAVAMCRVFYRRLPDPLPEADDALAMSQLWKRRYNSPLGAGTVEKALPHFQMVCRP